MLTAVISGDLNQPAQYLKWGFLQISPGNLAVIIIMFVVFVLALVLPFPKDGDDT